MLPLEKDPPQLSANNHPDILLQVKRKNKKIHEDALKQLDDLVHRRQLEWMALDRF